MKTFHFSTWARTQITRIAYIVGMPIQATLVRLHLEMMLVNAKRAVESTITHHEQLDVVRDS